MKCAFKQSYAVRESVQPVAIICVTTPTLISRTSWRLSDGRTTGNNMIAEKLKLPFLSANIIINEKVFSL